MEEIELQDWEKPVRIHPLTIKKFRRLAEIVDTFANTPEGEEPKTFIDILIQATAFCMETFDPELSDPEVLADHVDWPTMEHILEIAGGIKLNDPNLVAAMGGQN